MRDSPQRWRLDHVSEALTSFPACLFFDAFLLRNPVFGHIMWSAKLAPFGRSDSLRNKVFQSLNSLVVIRCQEILVVGQALQFD